MNDPSKTTPRGIPRLPLRNGKKISQRGLLSLAMMLSSIGALTFALLGGARLILDIFSVGLESSLNGLSTKAFVIGLAYIVGWLAAMVAIRIYSNLILPIIINLFTWGCLAGVCILYLLVLQRLYMQGYDMLHYWAYLLIVAAGLFAMVGLHLVIEGHDLRPFSIPLLIIALIQLGLIVFRYVFTASADPTYLWKDLLFFLGMAIFSYYMLAHVGLLRPLRTRLTNYFDRNSKAIRSED
ncbi:MAG TPA: hypothetical protein VJ821_03205 [Anaerolineales bacterium]|nr:hypothetical protein [Anaerolineales bacterium]